MRTTLVLGFVVAVLSAAPPAEAEGMERARLAGPAFLENLTIAPDGTILFTSYLDQTVRRVASGPEAPVHARLNAHPVSILPFQGGHLVAAHATPFTAGDSFVGTGLLMILAADGSVQRTVPVPEAGFVNGMVEAPDGAILIADSIRGAIHRFDPESGLVSHWFSDPALAPVRAPTFLPGANGLKREGGALLVSTSAGRALYRLEIGPDGAPKGPLVPVARDLPGADDFVVVPEGGYLVTTHGTSVIRIDAKGAVSVLTSDARIRGNTAVALAGSGAGRMAIILGTGGFSEGDRGDGVVLAVPFPVP